MKKISVIVPSYNCAAYIEETLNSILCQTVTPHEIIIIDDGSTDDTENKVKAFTSPLIKYVKQSNAGVSAARNHGLAKATGDLITFLDADDRWLPTMLERQTATMLSNPELVLSFTDFIRFDDPPSSNIYPSQFNFYPELKYIPVVSSAHDNSVKIIDGDGFCQLVSFGEIPAYTQTIMLRRSYIADLRFDVSLKICEDAEFILRCSTLGKVAFDSTVLVEVRRHQNNATRDISLIAIDKLACFIKILAYKNLDSLQYSALQKRLIRAYWNAAAAQSKNGLIQDSWHNAKTALRLPYPIMSKIKNFLSWLIIVLKSYRKSLKS